MMGYIIWGWISGYNKLYRTLEKNRFKIEGDKQYPDDLIAKRKTGKRVETVYIGMNTTSYFVGEEGKLVDVSFRKMGRFLRKIPV